jgi:RNA polymerase sigma-70 factor (ECF subfamily)
MPTSVIAMTMPDMHRLMARPNTQDRERRFDRIYADTYAPIRAYARRRCDPEVAQDIVAETFLVAWRRLDEVPEDALPWLYGVARRAIANARRGSRRAAALAERAAANLAPAEARDIADRLGEDELIRGALTALPDVDREAVMLVAWEGLGPADAARAAGCSRPAFAVRLHRARKRLAAALAAAEIPYEMRGATTEVTS